jgi:hypothetical protein
MEKVNIICTVMEKELRAYLLGLRIRYYLPYNAEKFIWRLIKAGKFSDKTFMMIDKEIILDQSISLATLKRERASLRGWQLGIDFTVVEMQYVHRGTAIAGMRYRLPFMEAIIQSVTAQIELLP